ncbi:MAG: hypothetical protein KAT43_06525 [Nanoarchaeota archaeon]|nr:hypothetical protein [Nanoarchaeota archaeon]
MSLEEKTLSAVFIATFVLLGAAFVAMGFGVYHGIRALQKYANAPVVERANIRGGAETELFIDRDGKKFYAEYDGKSIEDYLPEEKKK